MSKLDRIVELTEKINQAHKNTVAYSFSPFQKQYHDEYIQEKERLTIQLIQLVYGGQNE